MEIQRNWLTDRADRLASICDNHYEYEDFLPLIFSKSVPIDWIAISDTVHDYLMDCLTQYYQKNLVVFEDVGDCLSFYKKEILGLPNITPNGLILPKVGTLLSYNRIIKLVVNMFKNLNIKNIDRVYIPINIRLINGIPNEAADNRPRSSTKWHSDIWAGEFADSLMCHIPIVGNFEKNGIGLIEPSLDFFPKYVKTFNDFNEGADAVENGTSYSSYFKMKVTRAYFMDSFLLHKTMKKEPGLRLIVSFAMRYKDKLATDIEVESGRHDDYIDYNDWLEIGTTKMVVTDKKMEKFTGEDKVSSMYADSLKVIDLCP